MNIADFLDYSGVAMFAATGALAASRKQVDIIAFLFLATVTGVGGGTIRDLILGVPVFWVEQHQFLLVCFITAVGVYFTAHHLESRYHTLLWLDAVALASYGVFGAHKSLLITDSPVVAVVMGMMTGTMGGVLRDLVTGEPSVLMRKEIYITAAMVGALVFVIAESRGAPVPYAAGAGALIALALRSASIVYGWSLPSYKTRAPEASPGAADRPGAD